MNNIYVDSEQLLNCALNLKKEATNILTTFQNECSHAITAGNECLRVSGLDSSAVNTSLNKIFTNTYDQLMLLANFLATNVAQEYDLTTQAIAKSFNQEFANEIASLLGITVGTVTGGATGIGTNISGSSGIAGGYSGGSSYFGGTCGSSPSTGSPNASPYPNGNQTGQVNLTNLTPEEKAKLEAAGYKWQCGPDGCGWYKTDPNTGQPILADSSDLNKMYGILGADQNGKYKPTPSTSISGGTTGGVPSSKNSNYHLGGNATNSKPQLSDDEYFRMYGKSRDVPSSKNSNYHLGGNATNSKPQLSDDEYFRMYGRSRDTSSSINTSVSSTKSSYTNEKMDILGKTDNSPSFSSKSSSSSNQHKSIFDINVGSNNSNPSSKRGSISSSSSSMSSTTTKPTTNAKYSSSSSTKTTTSPKTSTVSSRDSAINANSMRNEQRAARTTSKVYDSSTKSNSKWA